jgi:sigma-B regulation protein RsbU (phosphoserine phosphatase)
VVVRDVTARRRADAVARELHARDAELELAARIQRHLYPERCPAVPGLELAGAVVSASATCGDYYDVLPRPDGSVLVAIGDVSGHGLGPALVMAEVRATIRSMVEAGLGPVEVLRHVDAVLASCS